MNRLEAAIERLHALEAESAQRLSLAKRAVDDAILALAQEVPDSAARRAAAQYLYWYVPEAKADLIAEAMAGESFGRVRHGGYFGQVPTAFECRECRQPLTFNSRSALHKAIEAARQLSQTPDPGRDRRDWMSYFALTCERCTHEEFARRRREQEEADAREATARQQRRASARTLSYGKYRETEWWAYRVRKHFGERAELTLSGCEICREEGRLLSVYHRSLMNLGDEPSADLCAACDGCARVLIREGILIPVPDSP